MRILPLQYRNPVILLTGLILVFAVFFISCKKTDFTSRPTKTISTDDFFKTEGIPSKKVASIIHALRIENIKTGFVSKLPLHAGLPLWDKLAIKQGLDVAARGEGDSTETYIIPLTENEHNLSSVIVARESDSGFLINCYTAAYLNGIAAGVNGSNIDAVQNTLLLFFMMESKCFGTSEFHHIPRMLFPQSHLLGSDSNKIITILPDTTGDSLVKCVVFKHCIKTAPCTEGSCDWCPLCISTYCYGTIPPGPEPPEPGPGGGGGGGGGTPCTNCPPPPPPDCFNPFYLVDPCAPLPVPPEPPADTIINPCIHANILAANPSFRSMLQVLQDVANNPNDTTEYGFIYNHIPNNQLSLVQVQGEPGKRELNFFVDSLTDGVTHNHFANSLSIFSPDDLWTICQVFLRKQITDLKTFSLPLVTATGVPYMLKIENVTKFRKFAEKYVQMPLDFYRDTYRYAYRIKPTNTAAQNEKYFLQYLKATQSGSGLKLFRGNATFTQWTPIGLSTNNNVITVPCP